MPPLGGRHFCDASKLRHFERGRQFQSKRCAKSAAKPLGFQHFPLPAKATKGRYYPPRSCERTQLPRVGNPWR
jgi:hypothetical protein